MRIKINDSISLEQIALSHASEYLELIEKNRKMLSQHFDWVTGFTDISHSKNFIIKCTQHIEQLKGVTWTIWHLDNMIGSITLYDWVHSINKISLGFWLDASYHGKGLMTQCVDKVLSYAFEDIQVNKVDMYFSVHNRNSYKLSVAFGFKIEGLLRKNYFLNGILEDQYISGLLREEYFINKSKLI